MISEHTVSATAQSKPGKRKFEFPSAVTTLAIVTLLVWVTALFIPAGQYATDADGSPIPGTYQRIESPLTFGERVEQLILAPVNGVYGLLSPVRGFVDTQTVGRLFGQIGVIVFIMAIGAVSCRFAAGVHERGSRPRLGESTAPDVARRAERTLQDGP